MMLVAERHGLVRALALPRDPRRALQLVQSDPQGNHDQPCQNQTHASQGIGAAVKYLRHEYLPCLVFFLDAPAVPTVTLVVYIFCSWVQVSYGEGNPEKII
jgi:hypothetical protein